MEAAGVSEVAGEAAGARRDQRLQDCIQKVPIDLDKLEIWMGTNSNLQK